jgi:hypothetical protein
MTPDPSEGNNMEGELEAPDVELETPAIEAEAEEQPVDLEALREEAEAPDEEAEEQQPVEPVEEEDEIDWNGKKFRAPKGVKDGILMHADYTKKTQEVAQHRKELEEYAERVSQQAKASENELQHRAVMHTVQSELESYNAYDWNAYQAAIVEAQQVAYSDPLRGEELARNANYHWNRKAHLSSQAEELGKAISEAENVRSSEAQQEFAKRMNDTQAYARSKGWTAETDKQVLDFAFSKGADAKTLQSMMSPLVYETLYLARLGEELMKKPASPAKANTPPPAPLTTVASKSSPPARRNLNDPDMPMDQFAATLLAKMAKR